MDQSVHFVSCGFTVWRTFILAILSSHTRYIYTPTIVSLLWGLLLGNNSSCDGVSHLIFPFSSSLYSSLSMIFTHRDLPENRRAWYILASSFYCCYYLLRYLLVQVPLGSCRHIHGSLYVAILLCIVILYVMIVHFDFLGFLVVLDLELAVCNFPLEHHSWVFLWKVWVKVHGPVSFDISIGEIDKYMGIKHRVVNNVLAVAVFYVSASSSVGLLQTRIKSGRICRGCLDYACLPRTINLAVAFLCRYAEIDCAYHLYQQKPIASMSDPFLLSSALCVLSSLFLRCIASRCHFVLCCAVRWWHVAHQYLPISLLEPGSYIRQNCRWWTISGRVWMHLWRFI